MDDAFECSAFINKIQTKKNKILKLIRVQTMLNDQ